MKVNDSNDIIKQLGKMCEHGSECRAERIRRELASSLPEPEPHVRNVQIDRSPSASQIKP
jgi:hypothetical protein